jgi:hypothetical protein
MTSSRKGRIVILILLLLLVWVVTRNGDDESQPFVPWRGSGAVTIRSVEILPPTPNLQSTLRAKVEPGITNPDHAYRYRWTVNQKEVGQDESLPPGRFGLDDTISLEVTLIDQTDKIIASPVKASMKVSNNVPVIKEVRLFPISVSAGDSVRAEMVADDADGNMIQFSYQWQVNGKMIDGNDQDTLSGDLVHSADRIFVVVTPSDPYSKGAPQHSAMLIVANRPPEIGSIPPDSGDSEGKYTYQIVAKDPDSDPLSYVLVKGPTGMEIHPTSGLVTWVATALSQNESQIELSVSDGKGGKAIQGFKLNTRAAR